MSATFLRTRIDSYGPLEQLRFESAPIPTPQPGEVAVRIAAAAVNPVDWKIMLGYLAGALPIPLPYTPGCDVSGVVEAVGDGVTVFQPGDAVFGYPSLLRGGGYAEYAVLLEDELALAPRNIPLPHAAAYPVAAITAYEGLFVHGQLSPGQRLLVLGGAGGVGSLAVQLGKIHGAEVFATTSGRNSDFVRSLGATPVDYAQPLAPQVENVDYILDCVGGQAGIDAIATLKSGGTFVTPVWPLPDPAHFDGRNAKTATYGILPNSERLETVRPWIESGELKMSIEREYPLADTVSALRASLSGRTRGKLLVVPRASPSPGA